MAWLLLERGVQLVTGLAVSILLARYLGASQFGELNFLISLVALLAPLAALGLNHILTKYFVEDPDNADRAAGTAMALRFGGGFVAIAVAQIVLLFVRPGDGWSQIFGLYLGVGALFNAFLVIEFWFLAKVESRFVAIAKIVGALISVATKALAVMLGADFQVFVILTALDYVVVGLLLLVAYQIRTKGVARLRASLSTAGRQLGQSWWLILSGLTATVNLKIDQVMLGVISTPTEVGLYAVAARLSEVWYFVPEIIVSSLFASILRARLDDPEAYQKQLQKVYTLLAWLGISVAVVATVIGPPLIRLLYGQEYSASGTLLVVHIWAGVFMSMRALFSKWLIAEELLKFSLYTQAAGAVTNVLLNLLLIPVYGAMGAAVSTVISYGISSFGALLLTARTRQPAKMMILALFAPALAICHAISRRLSRGSRHV
ncbi:flippase [Mycolicibacterium tokaiense]|uniref:flippase n=1 Tax=Mycolicibacterium tokaiense TaxID=39695 RepID=UPI00138BCEAA|nr:flippase [Mycolicibacterium tokaiense]BBY87355.1 O-unit flippase [Mycolicibacterium tokaiense]